MRQPGTKGRGGSAASVRGLRDLEFEVLPGALESRSLGLAGLSGDFGSPCGLVVVLGVCYVWSPWVSLVFWLPNLHLSTPSPESSAPYFCKSWPNSSC